MKKLPEQKRPRRDSPASVGGPAGRREENSYTDGNAFVDIVIFELLAAGIAAQAALLDADMGQIGAAAGGSIDVDHAGLDLLSAAAEHTRIVGVDISCKTVLGMICLFNDIIDIGEAVDAEDRAEELFGADAHGFIAVIDDGGFDECAVLFEFRWDTTAVQNLGALGNGVFDLDQQAITVLLFDLRAHDITQFPSPAYLDSLELFDELGNEFIVDILMNIQAVNIGAALATGPGLALDNEGNG